MNSPPAGMEWSLPAAGRSLLLGPRQTAEVSKIVSDPPPDSTDLSVVMLVKPGRPCSLLRRMRAAPGDPIHFDAILGLDGRVRFRVDAATGERWIASSDLQVPRITLFDGCRHRIAFVREGASHSLYIDGRLVSDGSRANPATEPSAVPLQPGALRIGGYEPDGGYWANPVEVFSAGIWNRALTLDEIDRVAFGFANGHSSEMVAYWPFCSGSTQDVSVNANVLSLLGGASFQTAAGLVYLREAQDRYFFLQIDGVADPSVPANQLIRTVQDVEVPDNLAVVFATISGRGTTIAPPLGFQPPGGAQFQVTIPAPPNPVSPPEPLTYYRPDGNWLVYGLKSPPQGRWRFEMLARADANYVFQVHGLSADQTLPILSSTLAPIFAGPDLEVAARKRSLDVLDTPLFERIAVTAFTAVLAGAAIASGGTLAPVAVFLFGLVSAANVATFAAAAPSHANTVDFVFNPHGPSKGILVLDAGTKTDQGADIVFALRKQYLYKDILRSLDYTTFRVHKLMEREDNVVLVREHLLNPSIVYVTASGHGSTDALFGWGVDKIVLLRSELTADMVRGKIFHFLACSCGGLLSEKIIELGGRAVIGYSAPYGVATTNSSPLGDWTVRCASVVDKVMLAGGTVQEAVTAAKAAYSDAIQKMEGGGVSPSVINRMKANRDLLAFRGDGGARL